MLHKQQYLYTINLKYIYFGGGGYRLVGYLTGNICEVADSKFNLDFFVSCTYHRCHIQYKFE